MSGLAFSHTHSGLGRWVKVHDFWPWSYRWTPEDARHIRELFKLDWTAEQVRGHYCVSETELQDVCRRYGIVVRR